MKRFGVARAISKAGRGSRSQATRWVQEGKVTVNGRMVRDPEFPVVLDVDTIGIAGESVERAQRVCIMLNKPRGLVTTTKDEHGRESVYRCFDGADLPWVAPVGRLDKASEGLLLFSNDPEWSSGITDPVVGPDKTYRVQVAVVPDDALIAQLKRGVAVDGERLLVKDATVLRAGQKNGWLELVLDSGRNRHIRRMLEALDVEVLRLMRVSIGPLELGDLAKGSWRKLTGDEVEALSRKG